MIVRLSSLGDILQCLPVVDLVKLHHPDCRIHWLTKSDFATSLHPSLNIDKLIVYDKKQGLAKFISLCWQLRNEDYTHIYDAHSNLRSHIACFILTLRWPPPQFLRRSKERLKRWLLFTWKWNLLPQPYRAAHTFLHPLKSWGLDFEGQLPSPQVKFSPSEKVQHLLNSMLKKGDFILAAPSAAWELKRWPASYWSEMIRLLPEQQFVLVGGPNDIMCHEIAEANSQNCIDLSGKLSWSETFEFVNQASLIVSGDTGVLHMADYLDKKVLAIIGPTAFGYPSRSNSQVLEVNLNCRPCTKDGRGRCTNKVRKKCLVDITPDELRKKISYTLGL